MISREEKNKVIVNELKKEKARKISKTILSIFFSILIIFTILFAYIYFIGVKGLTTKEYLIKDYCIPNSFYGVKILHFTDLLYDTNINDEYLNKLKEEIMLINPDIILFTGNIINKEYNISEKEINNLNSFYKELPFTIGKYAVRGDLDNSTFDLIMENTNFNILDNEIMKIYNNTNDYINIIGLNKEKTSINNQDNHYTITLINNFDDYNQINSNLILAGHNLGGEIKLFDIPLLGNDKYNNTYYEENNYKVYISSGIGSIHHMRFMNHPSINVYRLISK